MTAEDSMTPRQFFTIFGGFGFFLGSLGAVQLLVVSGGRVVPTLLALASGLAIGLACGFYRVLQLRYSETARARLTTQVEAAPPRNWKRWWIGTLLLLLPIPVIRGLDAPVAVQFTVTTLILVVVLLQVHRNRRR